MADEPDEKVRINPGYVLSQLARALSGTSAEAATRIRQWQDVLAGLLSGSIKVGARTPVSSAPAWVTLEVVHGGFATGAFAASGPLQPHEIDKLRLIEHGAEAADRAVLNLHYVGDQGRSELQDMLRDGCFRVHVPEEAALLVATWLIERGEATRAADLMRVLMPFFDRLRFYPVPHSRALKSETGVYLQTVGETAASLRATREQERVARMKEAVQVWAPLYDRATALFLETVEGDCPSLRTDGAGKLLRGVDGQPMAEGGWPCRRFTDDWDARAQMLLDDYRAARNQHQLCGKPERRKENFARVRAYMAACLADRAAFTKSDLSMLRQVLASYVTRRGAPGSELLLRVRGEQGRNAARPAHHAVARLVAERLQTYARDEGAPDLDSRLGPLSADEATRIGAIEGETLPRSVVRKAARCLDAPIESLLERELIRSSESMARLLPTLTAQARSSAIDDVRLRRVFESSYTAFRRRRSLLLLNLASQVKFGELPWMAAIEPWIGGDGASRNAARTVLVKTTRLAIEAFPHTIFPNKLVKELRVLATAAGESLPLVDELAADIFMGAFSETFLRSAQAAGRLLRGTMYERYYGLSYDRILALNDVQTQKYGVSCSAGFLAICEELAPPGKSRSWSAARNGTIIEQAQILTTHNLAVLVAGLDLVPVLKPKLPALVRRCFEWVSSRLQLKIHDWRAQLQTVKNAAYAWRQMVFYLSLLDHDATMDLLEWNSGHLASQQTEFRRRFQPVMVGLRGIAAGGLFGADGNDAASGGRRWLGWSVGRHWLLPGDSKGNGR